MTNPLTPHQTLDLPVGTNGAGVTTVREYLTMVLAELWDPKLLSGRYSLTDDESWRRVGHHAVKAVQPDADDAEVDRILSAAIQALGTPPTTYAVVMEPRDGTLEAVCKQPEDAMEIAQGLDARYHLSGRIRHRVYALTEVTR